MILLSDIQGLMQVRDFIEKNLDNVRVKMTSDQVKTLRNKVPEIDKVLIDAICNLDVNFYTQSKVRTVKTFESTEDVEKVLKKTITKDNETIK